MGRTRQQGLTQHWSILNRCKFLSRAFAGGATVAPNRFFPALGNHDMDGISCTGSSCSGAYLDYFTLPGNERYYDFVQGPVHFFMVNSDVREPDGNSATSLQANWLRQRLAASTARWKVVIVHHAPYTSSDPNGPEPALRWPYRLCLDCLPARSQLRTAVGGWFPTCQWCGRH